MGLGRRQTRKKRRARRRRAELRRSAGAVLRRSARTGPTILRESASVFKSGIIAVARAASGSIVRGLLFFAALLVSVAGGVTPVLAGSGRGVLEALARAASEGFAREPLLVVALSGSVLAGVASILAGKDELGILFCISAVVLCAVLWAWGRDRGGSEEEGHRHRRI